jgi:uncharacterized protein YdiU (UPF0061 family)
LSDLHWQSGFYELGTNFLTPLHPSPLPSPSLVASSTQVAELIGLDPASFNQQDLIEILSGNHPITHTQPYASVYSGHQFGVWAGQLGDGRAITLGQVEHQQQIFEIQLKGAGKTPYSRMGDGRAVLRSSIREYLCSEAMAGLHIPTTRALAITASPKQVVRETVETASVVARVAPSFIRFGHFEHFATTGQLEHLKRLADFVISHHFNDLQKDQNPYLSLFEEVLERSASLVAKWQSVGFCHGVLNTDNMSILGLTLDYGPFGFMDQFDLNHICNHTDQQGRYSYRMQPRIGEWNCYALGQAMVSLIGSVEDTQEALSVYTPSFDSKMAALWNAKLGLQISESSDAELVESLLTILARSRVDFSLFFRRLSSIKLDNPSLDSAVRDLFLDRASFDAWAINYRQRLKRESSIDAERKVAMDKVNPNYVLRNYLAQVAIEKAQEKDFSEIEKLLTLLENPFDEHPDYQSYAELPPDWAADIEVSCSS